MFWAFILTPLLVLPIVLLYRFVGCGVVLGSYVPQAPRYRDYIYPDSPSPNPGTVLHPEPQFVPKMSDVIGYWRLLDKPAALVAHDETGKYHGEYRNIPGGLPAQPGSPDVAASEPASGDFTYPHEGLIVSESAWCRFFNGGYVFIPFKPGLFTSEFTIEAWVKPLANYNFKSGRTLFSVGGRYVQESLEPTWHGFSLFTNVKGRWQVHFPGEQLGDPLKWPLVTLATTYLAITGDSDRLRLYVNGKQAVEIQHPSYNVPENAPLIIGIDNAEITPVNPVKPGYPVLSQIQEVVLYRKALAPEEIENRFAINSI